MAGAPRQTMESARLVIADDDLEMRSMLSEHLRGVGYEVCEACDGLELLSFVEDVIAGHGPWPRIDVLVSDMRMPGVTGLELLRALRGRSLDVPFVLITAFGDALLRAEAEALGAVLLAKPFELEALDEAVRSVVAVSTAGIDAIAVSIESAAHSNALAPCDVREHIARAFVPLAGAIRRVSAHVQSIRRDGRSSARCTLSVALIEHGMVLVARDHEHADAAIEAAVEAAIVAAKRAIVRPPRPRGRVHGS